MAFNFLGRLLGVDNAYLALPALVRAAFSTTAPLQIFAELTGLTLSIDADLPTRLGIDRYFEFLLGRLWASPFLKRDVPDLNEPRSANGSAVAYLDRAAHYTIIEESDASKMHPLFPLARALWQECGENPLLPAWLFHPYTVFDRLRDNVSPQFKAYWPPMFIIRLLHPELPLNNTVMVVTEQFARKAVPFFPEMTYSQYFTDIVHRKHIAYSLATDFYQNYVHNCMHTRCPFFPTGLCRRWFPIPEDFHFCEFPQSFQIYTHYRIDPEANALKAIKTEGGA